MPGNPHDEILNALLSLRDGTQPVVKDVWLVSRLNDGELLGTTELDQPHVFVPDLHLLTKKCEATYQYGFQKLNTHETVDRTKLFVRMTQALTEIAGLQCVQLGDYADLWRQDDTGEGGDLGEWRAITRDNNALHKSLTETLDASILAGNHDYSASKLLSNPRLLTISPSGKKTVLVTHGDCFDALEDLEDSFQQTMVMKFGPAVQASEYLLDRTTSSGTNRSKPVGGPPIKITSPASVPAERVVNVWQTNFDNYEKYPVQEWSRGHRLLARAFYSSLKFRGGTPDDEFRMVQQSLRPARAPELPDLRTIIIGHSHWPRICIHHAWNTKTGTPAQRKSLVFVDCGAWIEWSRMFKDDEDNALQPSCHLGVLHGGDFRIYQLNPHQQLYGKN